MRPVLGPSERIFRSSARKRLDLTLPGPTNSPGAGRPIPVHREHLEVWLARTGGDAVLCTASQSGEQLEFLVCSIGRRRLRPLRILFTKRRHRVTCQKVHSILRQSAARRPCQRTMAAKERLFGRRSVHPFRIRPARPVAWCGRRGIHSATSRIAAVCGYAAAA
jgi:hypothetical protein